VIIGIIAAVAIPNFLTAKQKAMQKQTMADLLNISTAVESYEVDNMYYPEASSIDELAGTLEPFYLPAVPRTDAWGHPYSYACWRSDPAGEGCESYRLASLGRDGILDFSDLRDYEEEMRYSAFEYDRDIVFGDGRFIYYPDGTR
jgi:type II secretory pathway pseudopilin PulG